jgi:hypothetical protein
MSGSEIQEAIKQLPEKDQWKLADWLNEFMADQWDREIERDVAAGKFDKIIAQAEEDMKAGRCTPL